MVVDLKVQYNGGFLPDIIPLTQAPIVVWLDGIIIVYYYCLFNYVLLSVLSFVFVVFGVWQLILMYIITMSLSPTLYC